MSYRDGWAALNLDMPKRIPRTEYSAASHWKLVTAVTGIEVGPESSGEEKTRARTAFMKAWNYDFRWSTNFSRGEFNGLCTSMGHAEYADGGVDYRDDAHCPFSTPEEALEFDPLEAYGKRDHNELVEEINTAYRRKCRAFPDAVNMCGVYITCISGLIDIFGWEMLLLACGTDPERFGRLTNRYAEWVQQYYDALADSDTPVVMSHDDIVWTSGPIFHPDWYRKYVFPNYREYYAPLRESGKKIVYCSDGNYTEFIDDIAATGVHGFVLEPTTDMAYIAENYGRTHAFLGNADTRILLRGTKSQIRGEVKRCMDLGREYPGFFMAVGNHIPANTPVENCLYYNRVYEEMSVR